MVQFHDNLVLEKEQYCTEFVDLELVIVCLNCTHDCHWGKLGRLVVWSFLWRDLSLVSVIKLRSLSLSIILFSIPGQPKFISISGKRGIVSCYRSFRTHFNTDFHDAFTDKFVILPKRISKVSLYSLDLIYLYFVQERRVIVPYRML